LQGTSVGPGLALVLCALLLVHLALAAAMGLSVDEAHYLLYAAHPALSYFDHPPLVGWLQWPLVALQAPTALLRLLPGALWLGTVLLVYRLAQGLTFEGGGAPLRAGLWAVAALALAPLLHVLAIGLLPDTLLMFLVAAVMLQTQRLMQSDALHTTWPWLGLGLLLGLAGLSKYTAIFFALAAAVCLLQAHGLRVLRLRALWAAIVLALLLVSPVLVWNARNGWISLSYQAQHGAGSAWQAQEVLRFALLQLLAYGPLLLWGMWARSRAGVLRLFFVLPFALLAWLSGGGSSLPHWTAPAWVALAPFSGVALGASWGQGSAAGLQRLRRLALGALVALQALVSAALLWLMLSAGAPVLPRGWEDTPVGRNPFTDLHGWQAAGEQARALAAQQGLASVSVQNWTLASRLGWYARPLPVHVLDARFDQFDLWAGDLPAGGDTLLVDWSAMAYAVPLGAQGFRDCQLLDTQAATHWGAPLASFRFYACHGWSGTAQPRLRLE
jgi:4-amino-4-deoxy-L-arabinose transferase-like glycosyltransferase